MDAIREVSVPFELFKSNVCHIVKERGDLRFIIETLKSDGIRMYYDQGKYAQAFYLLAMVDYLSRVNDLPLNSAYDDIRKEKLAVPVYPKSLYAMAKILKDDSILTDSLNKAIPEFRNFNIVENDVRNVT